MCGGLAHNDPTRAHEICRAYVYSEGDDFVNYRHVEEHADDAEIKGYMVVRRDKFPRESQARCTCSGLSRPVLDSCQGHVGGKPARQIVVWKARDLIKPVLIPLTAVVVSCLTSYSTLWEESHSCLRREDIVVGI